LHLVSPRHGDAVTMGWRANPRPVLEDLLEVERSTADLVVLVHRPELDDPWSPRRGEADLWVANTGAARPAWSLSSSRGQYCRFAPIAPPDLCLAGPPLRHVVTRADLPLAEPEGSVIIGRHCRE